MYVVIYIKGIVCFKWFLRCLIGYVGDWVLYIEWFVVGCLFVWCWGCGIVFFGEYVLVFVEDLVYVGE